MKKTFFTCALFFLYASIVALYLGGCAAPYHLEKKTHEDGSVDYVMFNNEITVEGAAKYHAEFREGNYGVERRCFVDVRKSVIPDGEVTYGIVVKYVGSDWLNIEKGRSLELVVGINSFVLSAEGDLDRQKDPTGDFVTEILDYPVSRELLLRLAQADKVDVIVNGHAGEVKGYFNEQNFTSIRRFVTEHVGVESAETPAR